MNEQPHLIYDLLGIGIGPFNLSLAALAHTVENIQTVYFDKNENFSWHSGMLIDNANLQVPFLADLVTLASPTHPFSFINYLQVHQRLYKFYFRENFHISRQEYNHYCQWVSSQLSNLHFNHRVTKVELCNHHDSLLRVHVYDLKNNKEESFYTKHLAVGIGTQPYIPKNLLTIDSEHIHHSAHFLRYNASLRSDDSICIVGSGQSAAEVVLELLNEYDRYPRKLHWITRSNGFFPMEYSRLGLEHFSPDYTNYFYHLDNKAKQNTIAQQNLMYKGISQQTIADIYDKLYQLTIANKHQPLTLIANSELLSIKKGNKNRLNLQFKQLQTQEIFDLDSDTVICATGYREATPDFLKPLSEHLITDEKQSFALNKDFTIQSKHPMPNKIFMQNNSLHSHGVGSPDLGLVCHRNSMILNSVANKECYPLHSHNVFQQFNTIQRSKASV